VTAIQNVLCSNTKYSKVTTTVGGTITMTEEKNAVISKEKGRRMR
jgi:hypothetical protein